MTERLSLFEAWQSLINSPLLIQWQGSVASLFLLLLFAAWLLLWLWRPSALSLSFKQQKLNIWQPLWSRFLQQQTANKAVSKSGLFKGQFLPFFFLFLLWLTSLNPYIEQQKTLPTTSHQQVTVAFVVETSVSFLLPDYELNGQQVERMAVVKSVLFDFMAQLQGETQTGSEVGLVIYADEAYSFLPLTHDLNLAKQQIQRLKPYLAGRNDAAMGEALGLGIGFLNQQPQGDKSTQQVSAAMSEEMPQHLVLISDGMALPSRLSLQEVVDYALATGIKIHTIGVGAGSAEADKRQVSGLLYQALESDSLKMLAQATGGEYFQVNHAQALAETLAGFKGQSVESEPEKQQVKQLLYPAPLSLALLVLCGWVLLSQFTVNKPLQKEASSDS